MKRLLKGVIQWGNSEPHMLQASFRYLQKANINWINPADEKIYKFVSAFFRRELDVPEGRVIGGYFEEVDDTEVVERLKDIQAATLHEGANYRYVLKRCVEVQQLEELKGKLEAAQKARANNSVLVKDGRETKKVEGIHAVVDHTLRDLADFRASIQPAGTERTEADIREVTGESWDAYQSAKINPALGKFCGIKHIDDVIKGHRRKNLWIHAGHVGEGKTLFGLNWVYNAVTRYQSNAVFVSLEMPFDQIRDMLCVMHSTHRRWGGRTPLDYRKVIDGQLSKEEELFFREVLNDFENNEEYCKPHVWAPDERPTIADIHAYLAILNKDFDPGLVCIDHTGLIRFDPGERYTSPAEGLKLVMQESKRMARTFEGEGLALLMLHQTNRSGKVAARTKRGYVGTEVLADGAEVERSADIVTTTYLDDDLRAAGCFRIQNLKNRGRQLFTPVDVPVHWPSKTLSNPPPPGAEASQDLDDVLRQVANL